MLLKNKVIIVTGAGGGIGAGIARVCHREGAKVVIADIRLDAAQRVSTRLGENAAAIACDVGDPESRLRLINDTRTKFGRIDGLVNNAGINFVKPFLDTTPEDWERIIRVDLRAVFFLTQLACKQMLAQDPPGGSIVNISSVHSLAALPGAGPYDAAKWGVVGLSKSIAVELAPQKIRVNVISPGLVNTQIWQDAIAAAPSYDEAMQHWRANIPTGQIIEPEEIGELAAFLLSDRSQAMTGSNVIIDGGMTSQLVSKEPYESRPIEGV